MQAQEEMRSGGQKGRREEDQIPSMALNHVSRLCRDVRKSVEFYTKVLGLVEVERPPGFDFDGAWLFNYGVGIHLIQANQGNKVRLPGLQTDPDRHLDPVDNHISFQCDEMAKVERRLKEEGVEYMKRTVGEGTAIDQLFFKDPDGFMIEICNCEKVALVPQRSMAKIRLPSDRHNPKLDLFSIKHI
ncbi:unnamed protein product [Cuscuta campestris]|uniref:VOC domain-containing protein n=2 Tax=Cuscuta sect. Cleistogrammica TaxID=1824901 RepID=A0A484L037_9ASTE|nr:hypothetical protein DM860_012657 [Cuscuta australis]VFQ68592.1 unnamed protein product [Cuscuta campestris]